MRRVVATAGLALALLAAGPAGAQGMGGAGAAGPNIPDMSPPPDRKPEFKAPDPIARKDFDKAVEKLFRIADTDHDGTATLAEFNAAIEARKSHLISERFAQVDSNGDHTISYAEFAAWQNGMGSVALSESAAGGVDVDAMISGKIAVVLGNSENDELLKRLVAPIGAVELTAANTNYDGGVSLEELLAWEGKRFDAADTNADGWLTITESEAFLKEGPGQG